MERGHWQIIHHYPNSKTRVLKTHCLYGTYLCGLLLPEKCHDSKLLVITEVFQDNYILSCCFFISITYFYAKMQENLFWCTFLEFWAFLLMSITILARDYVELWFSSKYAYFKEHINVLGKILSFDTRLYCLWNIVCVEKDWTLVNYISWCLTGHLTIWIRFASTKGLFS